MLMDVHFVFIIKTKTVVTFEGRVRAMIGTGQVEGFRSG